MKKNRKLLRLFFVMAAVMVLSMNAQAAMKLNKTKVTLIKGQTIQLKASGISGKAEWKSGNKSVATVTSGGLVKAKAKGTAKITASYKNAARTAVITVDSPKLSKTSASVRVGNKLSLKLKGTSQKVKWSSSNRKTATVSSKGVVTGKKAGTAKITAAVGSKKYVCKVTVKKKASSSSSDSGIVISDDSSSDDSSSDDSSGSSSDTSSGGSSDLVWIPRTGSKYHSTPTCSNMSNPSQVTLSEALAAGYTACSKCW